MDSLGIFCEGDHANFSCPEGQIVSLRIANYGRYSLGICNAEGIADWSTTCQNDRTLEILQKICNGKNSCEFAVKDELFGDPCPKTKKYLELKYQCIDKKEATTTTTTIATAITTKAPVPTTSLSKKSSVAIPASYKTFKKDEIMCESVEKRGIKWPKTKAGHVAKAFCPFDHYGQAKWLCDEKGNWSAGGYDLSNCIGGWTKMIQQDSRKERSEIDVFDLLNEIRKLTKNDELYGGDLVVLTSVINASVSRLVRSEANVTTMEVVVESVNNMAKKNQRPAWTDLKREDRKQVASSLMHSVDNIGAIVASSLSLERIEHCTTLSIVAEISNVKVHDFVRFPSMSLYDASYDSVDVPKAALSESKSNARVVYVTYKHMGQHVAPEPILDEEGLLIDRVVASNITSVSIIDDSGKIKVVDHLSQPVVITFVMGDQTNLSSPVCVWWNNILLEWSEEGCHVKISNETHTVCHCSHMTHFAVLMNFNGRAFSRRDEISLTVITYAGCTLSIVCLLFSIIAFQCFDRSGSDRVFIHKNLCFCLLVAESIFLFGIWQTGIKLYCSMIAVALHYTFLAALLWMLLEGVELYRMLVQVFPVSSKKLYLFLAGYGNKLFSGVPAVVVSISTWFNYSSYGTESYCWLKTGSYCFLWAFTVPVSAIVFFNFAFLAMTFRIVGKCRNSPVRYKCKDEHTTLDDFTRWIRGATALLFLLGLTWSFGFFWVDKQNVLLAYLFTICNALQGFFIFLYHVVYNDRMQESIRHWLRHSSWLPKCIRNMSRRPHSAPYVAGNRVPYGLSSNSSTGSELLYPSLTIEKYPQRMVASFDPLHNASVQMTCSRSEFPVNGMYEYATIPYETLCTQPFLQGPYYNHVRQYPVCSSSVYNCDFPHFRPPPNFPPPPPPPAPGANVHFNSSRPHSSTLTKVSDDSAYSDGSSTFQCPNESNASTGLLLRMDLTRNPPVFVQGM